MMMMMMTTIISLCVARSLSTFSLHISSVDVSFIHWAWFTYCHWLWYLYFAGISSLFASVQMLSEGDDTAAVNAVVSHLGICLSPGHSPVTWAFTSHLSIHLSPGHSPLTSAFTCHLGIYLSPGHSPVTWAFTSHLCIYLSPGHSPLTSAFTCHLGIHLSPGHSPVTWVTQNLQRPYEWLVAWCRTGHPAGVAAVTSGMMQDWTSGRCCCSAWESHASCISTLQQSSVECTMLTVVVLKVVWCHKQHWNVYVCRETEMSHDMSHIWMWSFNWRTNIHHCCHRYQMVITYCSRCSPGRHLRHAARFTVWHRKRARN